MEDLALGLIGLGFGRGEGVGLSAPSSPFWVIADLAVSLAGGSTVPIFNRISFLKLVPQTAAGARPPLLLFVHGFETSSAGTAA